MAGDIDTRRGVFGKAAVGGAGLFLGVLLVVPRFADRVDHTAAVAKAEETRDELRSANAVTLMSVEEAQQLIDAPQAYLRFYGDPTHPDAEASSERAMCRQMDLLLDRFQETGDVVAQRECAAVGADDSNETVPAELPVVAWQFSYRARLQSYAAVLRLGAWFDARPETVFGWRTVQVTPADADLETDDIDLLPHTFPFAAYRDADDAGRLAIVADEIAAKGQVPVDVAFAVTLFARSVPTEQQIADAVAGGWVPPPTTVVDGG